MKRRSDFWQRAAVGLAIVLSSVVAHAQEAPRLLTLHATVGEVVDAEENERFHLFDRDLGLLAARCYKTGSRSGELQLIGKKDGRPWIVIRSVTEIDIGALRSRIERGLGVSGTEGSRFERPVLSIKLPDPGEEPLELKLRDGSKILGKVRDCTPEAVHFVSLSGLEITVPVDQIKDVQRSRGRVVGGRFQMFDSNHNRLFFGPTARTLRQGEWNFSDFYIIFPSLAVGLADAFMLGGGVSLIPVVDIDNQLLFISPKIRLVHRPGFDLAVGALYAGVPDEGDFGSVYGVASFGDPFGSITVGVARPFALDDGDTDLMAFLLGGERQVSNRVKLITENWLFTDGDDSVLLISGGVRIIGERLGGGFALVTSPELLDEDDGFPFIPWLDFSVSFGR